MFASRPIFLVIAILAYVDQNRFVAYGERFTSPWHYECNGGFCRKTELNETVKVPLSLDVCQLFCGQGGALWPKPTGHFSLGNYMAHLNPNNISFRGIDLNSRVGNLIEKNLKILKDNIDKLHDEKILPANKGLGLIIELYGIHDPGNVEMTLDTNENYTLKIDQIDSETILVKIGSENYFGSRHGLETLSQLIVYNDIADEIQIVRDAFIIDGPFYPYRGILLDTSRNYIDKASILRTIEGMGMSKLNRFHWHITDSHSFPYMSRSWPNLTRYGSYSPSKIYTQSDIKEIIEFGILRGVRIIPEFDAPAHVGEGWQSIKDNVTVCFAADPWQNYCVEPPCGQLNPTNDKVYEILEGIYRDMIQDFSPDIFHMGGDEVNINCWNSSQIIRNWMTDVKGWNLSESNFIELWNMFQNRAYEKLKIANNGKSLPAMVWTSGLTSENNIAHLDPIKYIIQIWTTGDDPTIGRLLKNNFKMIFSNYDALYLDCGFGAWVGEGNNWCSPYKGWQKVYENSPMKMIKKQGYDESKKHLILGGEATLWSEQVDGASVDSKLWPRSAAMAERLWGEPASSWIHAEQRLLRHRERLIKRGVFADSLEPEWCLRNQGKCYL